MKKLLFALLLVAPAFAQRPALVPPVVRFSDNNGLPLTFGKLYTYQAGTTTPLSTYTDSTTGAVNTNPVILDATGSGRVFLGANVYKLVLQNAAGVVQWTADNIAQGMFQSTYVSSVFGRSGAVTAQNGDYTCAQVTGCPTLPTPPTLYYQTVKTAGTAKTQEPALNFITGNVGAVFSLAITAGGTGYTGAPTVTFTGGSCTSPPTASANVTSGAVSSLAITFAGAGCTTAPTVGFSGGGGTGATATAALTPSGITCVDNPTTTSTDCTFAFASTGAGTTYTLNDVTGSRSFGTSYQNTTTGIMYISGAGSTGGSSTGNISVYEGSVTPSTEVYSNQSTATVAGGSAGFSAAILPGYYYQVNVSGTVSGPSKWVEITGAGGGGGGSISLTTTGSSGPATLTGSVLNIPVYTGGSGTPGGSNHSVQFNSSGIFAGTAFTGLFFASTSADPRAAIAADVVNLWSSCSSGYLKFDGTCSTPSGGATFPGSNAIVFNTSTTASRNATSADVISLWTSCTVGFLKFDGTCANPSGSGTVTSYAAPSGSWPTWLVPTVTNATTTPSLAVAASTIPTSLLGNAVQTNPTATQTMATPAAAAFAETYTNWDNAPGAGGFQIAHALKCYPYTSITGDTGGGNTPSDTACLQTTANFGPEMGWAEALSPSPFEFVYYGNQISMEGDTAGIAGGLGIALVKSANMESTALDLQTTTFGNCWELSAECASSIRTSIQSGGFATGGMVATASANATQLLTTGFANHVGPSRLVLDTTTAVTTSQTLGAAFGQNNGIITATLGSTVSAVSVHGTLAADVSTPRVSGNGDTLMTIGVTLASAYAGSSTALMTIAGSGNIETTQIVSVGSYSGGVQTFTVRLLRPFLLTSLGTDVFIGGTYQGYCVKNTTLAAGEFYLRVLGTGASNVIYESTLFAGQLSGGNYTYAGNVTLYPCAEIQSIATNGTTVNVRYIPVAFNNGDSLVAPEGIAARFTAMNNTFNSDSPFTSYGGINLAFNGPASNYESDYFNIISNYGTGTLVSQGGASAIGHAFNVLNMQGKVGSVVNLSEPPSDMFLSGNAYMPTVINVNHTCTPPGCPANYNFFTDTTNGQNGGYQNYTEATNKWQFGGVIDHSSSLQMNLATAAAATIPPNTMLGVSNFSTTATSPRIASIGYGATPFFSGVYVGGTQGSPTAVASGTEIGGFNFWAYNGTALNGPVAGLRAFTAEVQTPSAAGSRMDFRTTNIGTTTPTTKMSIENDGTVNITAAGNGIFMLEGTAPAGVASSDIIYPDSTAHRLKENPNNAGAVILGGIASAGTPAHCLQIAANGIDYADTGAACGGSGSSTTGTGFWHNTSGTLDGAARAVNLASADVTGITPVANGGTGTSTPGLVAGSNVTITGTWPNQTVAAAAAGTGISGATAGQLLVAGSATTATSSLAAPTGAIAGTIASGTSALGTSAIASATCATVVTTTATGVATTDVVLWGFNGDPTAVTGYVPLTTGMLTIITYPSSGNVNFKVCNNTSASITPGAITLNWRITR